MAKPRRYHTKRRSRNQDLARVQNTWMLPVRAGTVIMVLFLLVLGYISLNQSCESLQKEIAQLTQKGEKLDEQLKIAQSDWDSIRQKAGRRYAMRRPARYVVASIHKEFHGEVAGSSVSVAYNR